MGDEQLQFSPISIPNTEVKNPCDISYEDPINESLDDTLLVEGNESLDDTLLVEGNESLDDTLFVDGNESDDEYEDIVYPTFSNFVIIELKPLS